MKLLPARLCPGHARFLQGLFLLLCLHPANAGIVDLAYSGMRLLDKLSTTLSSTALASPATPRQLDMDQLEWDGGPVTLDAGSRPRRTSGASRESVELQWRVVEPAAGSSYRVGQVVGTGRALTFTPDKAGVWRFSVSFQGETLGSPLSIRLYRMAAQHPRIYLNARRLAALRDRAGNNTEAWRKLKKLAERKNGEMLSEALYSVVSGEAEYCRDAVALAFKKMGRKKLGNSLGGDLATVYDWCAGTMTGSEKERFIGYLNDWGDRYLEKTRSLRGGKPDNPGLGNYWPRFSYSFALIGLATYGDNPRAREWLDYFRFVRWPVEKAFLDLIAKGGGWPEGFVYDAISNFSRMRLADAWLTATGEDLFESSDWFRERFGTLLLQHLPGVFKGNKLSIHPYTSFGDYERNRVTMDSYWRIAALILIERYPDDPIARQLQAYLAAPETGRSHQFIQYAEFLWFDADRRGEAPTLKSHYDPSLGNVFLRGGWPDGADDLDPRVTVLNFRCGDFFAYHQHLDQNSFTLYRSAPLLLDSGVYSGNGTSNHDANYYIRTIAHNTLVVYNKNEDFKRVRYNASSNDGGQRAVYPATRAPRSVEQYRKDRKYYDTCDMTRFIDRGEYVYLSGDGAKAYNSSYYAQSWDTGMKNNIPKVKAFNRELVYLRSSPRSPNDYVVLYDRVEVTRPEFSGSNTKLLFHLQEKPSIPSRGRLISAGETLYPGAVRASAINGEGKLMLYSLLPKSHNLRVVGGRGKKAYWVFGKNYNWHWKGDENSPNGIETNFEKTPYGQWRIEVEPADNKLAHNFLTVLFPTESDNRRAPKVQLIQDETFDGVMIHDESGSRMVLFARNPSGSGMAPREIEFPVERDTPNKRVILAGLKPGARYALGSARGGSKARLVLGSQGKYLVNSQGVLEYSTGE